jgi:hypothetical protein
VQPLAAAAAAAAAGRCQALNQTDTKSLLPRS